MLADGKGYSFSKICYRSGGEIALTPCAVRRDG